MCTIIYKKINFCVFQKLFKDKYLEELMLSELKDIKQFLKKKGNCINYNISGCTIVLL